MTSSAHPGGYELKMRNEKEDKLKAFRIMVTRKKSEELS